MNVGTEKHFSGVGHGQRIIPFTEFSNDSGREVISTARLAAGTVSR